MALVTATFCKLLSVRYGQSFFFIQRNDVFVNVGDVTCHRVPNLFPGDFVIQRIQKPIPEVRILNLKNKTKNNLMTKTITKKSLLILIKKFIA